MKYLIPIIFLCMISFQVQAKSKYIQAKTNDGKTYSGEYKGSLFRMYRIKIEDEKTGKKQVLKPAQIQSAVVTDKKGVEYIFSTFPVLEKYPNSGTKVVEYLGQEIVSSDHARLYLTYTIYSVEGSPSKTRAIETYYAYAPNLNYAVELYTGHGAFDIKTGNTFQDIIMEAFGDNPSIRKKIENKDFKRRDIVELVTTYNKKSGYSSTVHEELNSNY